MNTCKVTGQKKYMTVFLITFQKTNRVGRQTNLKKICLPVIQDKDLCLSKNSNKSFKVSTKIQGQWGQRIKNILICFGHTTLSFQSKGMQKSPTLYFMPIIPSLVYIFTVSYFKIKKFCYFSYSLTIRCDFFKLIKIMNFLLFF